MVFLVIITVFIEIPVFNANRVDPDQTPRSVASDLDLHCLPMSRLWAIRHRLIKPQPVCVTETVESSKFILYDCAQTAAA